MTWSSCIVSTAILISVYLLNRKVDRLTPKSNGELTVFGQMDVEKKPDENTLDEEFIDLEEEES